MIEKMERILEEYKGHRISISKEMDLRKDLDMNSLELIEMVVELEEAFGIEITDREIVELTTVGDVLDLIRSKE